MGKLITVWSPQHGQFATTSTMVAIASRFPNTIVTHIQNRMSNLERMFGYAPSSDSVFNDSGLNALVYGIVSHDIDSTDIEQALVKVTDKLKLLPSFNQNGRDTSKKQAILKIITEKLPRHADYVMVDLPSGMTPETREYMEKADVNIIVLNQNTYFWKDYAIPNAIYVISKYDFASTHTASRLKSKVHAPVYIVPYCTQYMDAIAEGKASSFLLKNNHILDQDTVLQKDSTYDFFNELGKVKL